MQSQTTAATDEFVIIGAGFGRTGTSSLREALNKLGFKCHHMTETFGKEDDQEKIIEVSNKKIAAKLTHNVQSFAAWDKIMASEQDVDDLCQTVFYDKTNKQQLVYRACVDFPMCLYYQELMRKYPNAKVILTVRDSAEKWYESVMGSIFPVAMQTLSRWQFRFSKLGTHHHVAKCIFSLPFDCDQHNKFETNKQFACDKYEEWNESVERYVKQQNRKLLVFNVKQGWAPLCKFLEIEKVPKEPFPHANDRSVAADFGQKMNILCGLMNVSLVVLSVGVAAYFSKKYYTQKKLQ